MGFLVLSKHGLNKTWIRAKFGLILEDQTVKREEGREEEEEEGRGEEEDQIQVCFQLGIKCILISQDFGLENCSSFV